MYYIDYMVTKLIKKNKATKTIHNSTNNNKVLIERKKYK